MDVLHPCIWVSDLEQTRAFYEDALGLKYAHDFEAGGVRSYYVTGDGDAEIQFKYDPERTEPIEPGDLDHIAVGVDDCDAMVEHMVAKTGCEVVQEPRDGTVDPLRFAFIRDPDGYLVEILHELDE